MGNTRKKLATVLAVSATIATTGMINQQKASADTVDNNQTKQKAESVSTPVEKAQTQVNNAQADVATTQKAVDDAKAEQQQAQQNLAQAKDEETQAKTAQDNAQKDVETSADAVKDAQADYDATQAKNDAIPKDIDSQVEQQNNKVESTSNQLTDAKAVQTKATADANAAQSEQTKAQNEVDGINNQINDVQGKIDSTNKITLTDDYVNAVKNHDYSKWNEVTKGLFDNHYKQSVQDNREIDLDNMSQQDLIDLSTFVASIVNPLHEKLGTPTQKVTKGSIQFAKSYAKNYLEYKNQYSDSTLDRIASTNAAKDTGIEGNTNYKVIVSDNFIPRVVTSTKWVVDSSGSYIEREYAPITLGQLKGDIYDAIVKNLTDVVYYGYILGLENDSYYFLNGDYMALVVLDNNFKIVTMSDKDIVGNFDKTPYEIPSLDTTQLKAQLAELKDSLGVAQTKLNAANSDLIAKQGQKSDADKKVSDLTATLQTEENKLAELKNQQAIKNGMPKELAATQKKVADATAKYNEAKKKYEATKDAYEAARKKTSEAADIQAAADKKVNEATANLDKAKDALAKAEQNLDTMHKLYDLQEKFEDGHWRLYNGAGQRLTGFQRIESQNKTVYYDKNGNMQYGQQQINGKWYLFNKYTGAMQIGFQRIDDQKKTVYYNDNGQMLYGQQNINGHWYLFDKATGAMQTGFQNIPEEKKTVYYNAQGQMLYGQQNINGHWYLFDKVTGAMQTGFQNIPEEKKTVYYNAQGQMLYGQQNINGRWYNFDRTTGAMSTGFTYLADQNKKVYYNVHGQMQYGWQTIDGGRYYFDTTTGTMATGQKHAGKDWYNFDTKTGKMSTGITYLDDQKKTVYYANNGKMQYGQQRVNGYWYLLIR